MSTSKNKFVKIILTVLCLSFVFSAVGFAAQETAADKLEKGKQLYNEGKYDQAMDNFIDVFVQGNSEQISEANEYVNMIHFSMGAVAAPKQVPYDPNLEPKDDGHKGKVISKEKMNPYEQEEAPAAEQAPAPRPSKAPVAADQKDAAVYNTPVVMPKQGVQEQIVAEDVLAGDPAELKAMRKEQVDSHVSSMTAKIIERLGKVKGVNVYMRGGLIDAIDIESDVIFKADKITYTPQAKAILDDVYSLMILSGTPSFVLLPPGSYTDDVSIQGVRQAVALNSYFINMGISSAKLNFNMGLTSEQPPAKFSDLEGISIVFDYTAKPNLKVKLAGTKATAPVLSIGTYPFESFKPQDDEGMLVDFSVVETSNPVADWKLQIIQHAKDGKYYIVRQISGTGAVYQQMYWNGRKQYFGPVLPYGRYTLLLTAKDSQGLEKIVRRKVTLVSKDEPKPVAKEAKGGLDYNAARLWTKPSRTAGPGANEVAAPATEEEDAQQAPSTVNTYSYNDDASSAVGDSPVGTANIASAPASADASAYSVDPNDPLISGSAYSAPVTAPTATADSAVSGDMPSAAAANPATDGADAAQYPSQQPQEIENY